MLVIDRKAGGGKDRDAFTLTHPDGTVVTVRLLKGSGGGWVRLGIEAPRSVVVERPDMKWVPAGG